MPPNRIILLSSLFFFLSLHLANGQLVSDHYRHQRYRETTLNVTSMLQTFPLFNRITDFRAQEPTFIYKWALSPRRPRALRIGLGAIIDESQSTQSKLYLSFGTERNRLLFNNFYIMTGFDFYMSLIIDEPGSQTGFAWPVGFKYDINKRLSIYTEARLSLGVGADNGGIIIETRPPTSIYVGYRFYRAPKQPKK